MLIMLVAACASEIRPPVVRHSGFSIPFPDPDFTAEPEEISQAAAPDYATVLKHAARKDKQALERLFAISAAGDWTLPVPNFIHNTCARFGSLG